ncbi:MAG: DUF1295 domain-containing protein [Reichenbachiella sp.]
MDLETFKSICVWWSVIAVCTFILLQFVTAPYGRHNSHKWGLEINNRTGWILMEAPSFFIMLYYYLNYEISLYAAVLFLAWLLHYLNRTFIFPFRIRTKGKKMPLAILGSAIGFNTINAGLNGYFIAALSNYTTANFYNWTFYFGVILFLIGMIINQVSDSILINLRSPKEKDYKIPHGFMFKYISCPNHFGEMIQWLGFGIMAWNYAALAFFLWTLANLIPRALKHHKWYKANFNDYPVERKSFIPKVI